jgi:hypothetical protein
VDFDSYGGDFTREPFQRGPENTPQGYWGDDGDEQLSVEPYRTDLS